MTLNRKDLVELIYKGAPKKPGMSSLICFNCWPRKRIRRRAKKKILKKGVVAGFRKAGEGGVAFAYAK